MKTFLLALLLLAGAILQTRAQDNLKTPELSEDEKIPLKFEVLPEAAEGLHHLRYSSIKENFITLNTKAENGKYSENDSEVTPDDEGFNIPMGFYYFAGAAAVAAIIYFLVPDNDPPAEKKYTFGLPLTPQ